MEFSSLKPFQRRQRLPLRKGFWFETKTEKITWLLLVKLPEWHDFQKAKQLKAKFKRDSRVKRFGQQGNQNKWDWVEILMILQTNCVSQMEKISGTPAQGSLRPGQGTPLPVHVSRDVNLDLGSITGKFKDISRMYDFPKISKKSKL